MAYFYVWRTNRRDDGINFLTYSVIIGLTGGIASGKTLCSDWFAAHSIAVIDADVIAREIVAIGSPLLAELVDFFGSNILTAEGALDRPALRTRVFTDAAARNYLNAIMQPAIRSQLLQQLSLVSSYPYCVLSAPLLLENRLNIFCNLIVVVDVSVPTQLIRGSHRDQQKRDAIAAIIATQMARDVRLHCANYIINNDNSIVETHAQLEFQQYCCHY